MTQAAVQTGFLYPEAVNFSNTVAGTIDAATEKIAMIGRLRIDGKPAGSKTLSTGSIQFRTGTVTFANGATTVDIGIQDVAAGAGPIAQPDGTFDVKTTLTGGAGLVTNTWTTATMNIGSKSMSDGDLIAIVFDMTAQGGVDSVNIEMGVHRYSTGHGFPTTNQFVSSAWQTTQTLGAGRRPNVVIVFDDGTLGWIDGGLAFNSALLEAFQDSTNPDECGLIFQVPWDCKVDELWFWGQFASAAADFTMNFYSDPLAGRTLIASDTFLGEQGAVPAQSGRYSVRTKVAGVVTDISLAKNTDYLVTVQATGTANLSLFKTALPNTNYRHIHKTNGLTMKKATSNNGGAFTAESPAVTMYEMGVRICSLDDGTGAGSGGLKVHPGMAGGLNG